MSGKKLRFCQIHSQIMGRQATDHTAVGHHRHRLVRPLQNLLHHRLCPPYHIRRAFPAAMAAEMEGGAVAQAASMSGVPFAVVRAISDLADGTAAASFEQFEQHAADVSAAAVLQALALLD